MGQQRNYLVIGAAGGIGAALCGRLAARGAGLYLAGRREDRLSALASGLSGAAFTKVHAMDASDFAAMDALIKAVAADGLHGAVNLAGSIILKPAHLTTPEEYAEHMRLNLQSAFALVRSSAIVMQRAFASDQISRSIVLMTTTAARIGLPNHELIAAAKGGVEGLVRSAAATYASGGVRVNCVAPGLIDTPMASKITGNAAALEASKAMHPLGRIGAPDDVAPLIDWLLSDESGFVTGQSVAVDGGMSTVKGRAGK